MDRPAEPIDQGAVRLPGGRKLGYATFGHPEGDAVVWFQGTPGARLQVPPEVEPEGHARGFRIVTLERPGNGASSRYLYRRVRDIAGDVEAFADALGIEHFAVVGLSGGGPYVLACAHDLPHRVRAAAVLGGLGPTAGPDAVPSHTRLLALMAPVLGPTQGALGWGLATALRALRPVARQALWTYMRLGPRADRPVFERPEMAAMFIQDLIQALDSDLRGPVFDMNLFARHWGFSLADITVPCRFWAGDADPIVPLNHAQHQADRIPDSQLFLCPGAGHFAGFTAVHHVLDELDSCWQGRQGRALGSPGPASAQA